MDPISESSLPAIDESTLPELWRQYERALERLTPQQLMEQLTAINSGLQPQPTSTLSNLLLDRLHSADQPVVSSTTKATPSSADRDRPAASRPSPPPSPIELLSRSQRLGPRLAAKLVLASARAARRDDV